MCVFIMDPICDEAVQLLSRHTEVVNYPQSRERDWKLEAEAIIVRTYMVTADDLAEARRLRIVANHGVGLDNIDIPAAKRRQICVTSTPGANAQSVAEYVVALTLALARRIREADKRARNGNGVLTRSPGTFELAGKTVGLVGFGDIAQRVARIFSQGFGCQIIGHDPFVTAESFAARGVQAATSLNALLAQADIVSLHVPINDKTRGLIGRAELALMKNTAVLINTARGGIVDEADLHAALKEGVIGGAASDVFVDEPVPKDHPLFDLDNFIASPHAAGSTRESLVRMGVTAAESIIDVLHGRHPQHAL